MLTDYSLQDDDVIYAGTGNDYVSGGGGADEIYGGSGDDTLVGDGSESGLPIEFHGADYIDGGTGDDAICWNIILLPKEIGMQNRTAMGRKKRNTKEGGMKRVEKGTTINSHCIASIFNFLRPIRKVIIGFITTFILITFMTTIGGCISMFDDKDSISELSFSHDGKKVVFDRCRSAGCQIQVYDLETAELAAYQSPKGERWTMGKYSYDGKKIAFSVIPTKGGMNLGEMQIAVMDADGKNFKKVTTGPGAKLYPAFSHNGKKILYARAARIREKGGTPAAQYDAWEVNLETGEQTQLTFFKYYYMGYLTYFPDDERFIYFGENPSVLDGAYADQSSFRNKLVELGKKGIGIYGVVVMKGKEMIPNPYTFPEKTLPMMPLLSKDGSVLIYEKYMSAGKFYLYSEDGNHKFVHHVGSVDSVAISPDGEYFGTNRSSEIFITRISDRVTYRAIFVRRSKNWDENVKKMNYLRLLPEQPLRVINR